MLAVVFGKSYVEIVYDFHATLFRGFASAGIHITTGDEGGDELAWDNRRGITEGCKRILCWDADTFL
ncbi:MAG TPA: hypothetical protein DEB39_16295 [Planctomycetaceae bacterium]|nr:hypothetical protein [Planctomycetaceae bacterium]